MLKCFVLSSILLVAVDGAAAAKNIVLHCRGYQVGDRHPVTDQIITLDMENNIVVSIQLGSANPKDVVNTPIKVSKQELQWSTKNTFSINKLPACDYFLMPWSWLPYLNALHLNASSPVRVATPVLAETGVIKTVAVLLV